MNNIIVLATRNKGKTIEIREMLKGFPVEIKNLDDFGPIPEVEEDGNSFEENAYIKASFAARILGYPAIADDSGLVVEALGGRPGIKSARYSGERATDESNVAKLIEELQKIEKRDELEEKGDAQESKIETNNREENIIENREDNRKDNRKGNKKDKNNRNAAFECVISIAVPTGAALTYVGRCEGVIIDEPIGNSGFGYDPVFLYPELGKTFAEMSIEEKSRISHRGRAFQEIIKEFDKILEWIDINMPRFEAVKCQSGCL